MNSRHKLSYLIAISSVVSGMGFNAQAQLQTAGDLFVDIDATVAPAGSLSSITNNGTLGGFFEATAGVTNAGTIPIVATEGIARGIRFDGAGGGNGDFMQLVGALGGALTPPPAGLVGLDPTRTIEVWAYNPTIAGEETMVSWARRGGGNGSNISFNYGSSGAFGAIGHWGGQDIAWDDLGGAPFTRQWHHLAYTYDGTTTRVYVDGALANMEVLGAGAVNSHANTSIQLAAQLEPNGVTVTPTLRGSLTLARVRIHDGVLSGAQILNNFDFEKGTFLAPPAPAFLSSGPVHRYEFKEPATNNATGLAITDSVGTAHGTVLGAGASFSGSRLVLAGGSPTNSAYGDLPNGLLSVNSTNNAGNGKVTIEGWAKVTGSRASSRLFDFGTNTLGEQTGPSVGPYFGSNYLFYSAQNGGNVGVHRLESRHDGPPPAPNNFFRSDVATFKTFLTDLHFVVTWDEATGLITAYENGLEVGLTTVSYAMSAIQDVNAWLGRSNFAADQNTQGEYDEFRIYDRVLSPGEILGNFQAGPNTMNTNEQPVSIVQQPQDTTAFETYRTTLSVATAGTPPISYQWLTNGTPIPGATSPSYSLTATLADNGTVFSVVVSNFALGQGHVVVSDNATLTVVTPAPVLKHRYTFNQTAGETNVVDVESGRNGVLRGGGAFTGDGKLQLNGTDSYVNLANNLVTGFTSITIEAWVQDEGSGGWARIFDFGNSGGGEDFPIGSAGTGGLQYMFLAFPSGLGNLRGAYTVGGGGAAEQLIEWLGNRPPANAFHHIVWVSLAEARTGRLFVNGAQVGENRNVTLTPAALGPTVNNWLGRAQFNDPLFRGKFDEFCIWDGAMLPAQVQARFAEGPSTIPAGARLSITRVGDTVKICWHVEFTAYFLESTSELGSTAAWDTVFADRTIEGDQECVTIPASDAQKFYRLTQ